ncbi:MAG TPA: protein translocase subunit SecD [Longimicrobiales bacterium]|nr:protein translocase subunit SecD [Longimicrobiales bacterium]
MFGNLARRLAVIALAIGMATFFLFKNKVKEGLDLVGGMYLAVEVRDPDGTMTAQAKQDATDQALEVIRNRIDQFGVAEPNIQKYGEDRIIVELPGIRDEDRAKNIIRQTAYLEFQLVKPTTDIEQALPRIDRAILQAMPNAGRGEATRDTTEKVGPSVSDLLFQRDTSKAAGDSTQAQDSAVVSTRPEDRPLTSLLRQGPAEGEFLVAEEDAAQVDTFLKLPQVQRLLPRNTVLRWGKDPTGQGAALYKSLYVLDDRKFMDGTAVEDAQAGKDPQYNYTIVTFQLNRSGGRTFDRVTSQNIGNRIAIVLDQNVVSAPTVQSRISTNGQIEMGNSPMTEARDLALVLRSGALPAEIEIIEQRTVGPSLGDDAITRGRLAGLIGVLLVITIMIVIYRFAGLLSILALAIYVLLVLGGLAFFQATLTAPGIAGMVLSVGMAVDANILIFERIREEILAGRTQRVAVDEGFKNALSAIIDSNLSSIITALILYQIGTGPVRGFAVTLILGVVASFFTAVFITRTFFLIYMDRKSAAKPISI